MLNKLAGVRVLEIGRLLPSAIAGYELAKLGADVVKVEFPPHGDYLRDTPPFIDARGDQFLDSNRNKRSLAIDATKEAGRKVYLELAAKADVIIASARLGTYERLGIGYDVIKARNPGIVFCMMSGFGQTGPYSELGAHGYGTDLAAGVVNLEDRDGKRVIPDAHFPLSPRLAGLNAAMAIMASLFRKQATGEGDYLDVAQFDAAVAFGFRNLVHFANNGTRGPTFAELGVRYQIQVSKDDKALLFAIPESSIWLKFCRAVERPDLEKYASDQVMDFTDPPELRVEMAKVAAQRTMSEWIALAIEVGIPISPYLTVEDLPTNEHALARRMLVSVPSPNTGKETFLSGSAVKYGSGDVTFTSAPEMGADSTAVLSDYGIEPGRINQLMTDGVVRGNQS